MTRNIALPPYPGLEIEDDQVVWNGRYPLHTIAFTYQRFDGTRSGRLVWELWRRGRAAAMLPYDPVQDSVVLIEQFRLPGLAAGLPPIMTEIPAGMCDGAESEADTMTRELREEIGLDADLAEPIGRYILTAGGADETVTIFVGRVTAPPSGPDGLVGTGGLADEQEDIRIQVRPAEEAIAEAIAGRVPNSVAAIALLWLGLQRPALRARWSRST